MFPIEGTDPNNTEDFSSTSIQRLFSSSFLKSAQCLQYIINISKVVSAGKGGELRIIMPIMSSTVGKQFSLSSIPERGYFSTSLSKKEIVQSF